MTIEQKISDHFYLSELTKSQTAIRKSIDNSPSPEHLAALKTVCEKILEPVYLYFQTPIKINSGYRSPKLNTAVGGSKKSQHCNGEAVDFEINGISNVDLAYWIIENLEFDQLIFEFYNPKEGPNSGWIHCSYTTKTKNRRNVMTAMIENGQTVYKTGIVL